MAYCSVADVKLELNIASPGDDFLFADDVTAAQQAIDDYCHRTFEGTDSTKYIDALGDHIRGKTLYLDDIADGELASITSIVNGDGVTVASTEYVTTPRNETPYRAIKLLTSSGKLWTWATDYEGAIAITGIWAYSATAPAAIQRACIRLASYYYKQKDAQVFDVTATPELGQITIPQSLPADVRIMLRPYTKP